jgi:hypothetical protein
MDFDKSAKNYLTPPHDIVREAQLNAENSSVPMNADIVSPPSQLARLKNIIRSPKTLDAMTTKEPSSVIISRLKARQDLHLPPFRSLLIAAPSPNLLLTPPDDTDSFFWKPVTEFFPPGASKMIPHTHPVSMFPQEDRSSNNRLIDNAASDCDAETHTQQSSKTQSLPSLINPQTGDKSTSASNVEDIGRYGGSGWLQEAVEVAGKWCTPQSYASELT